MHVFLTGASGFIGSAVRESLVEAGHTVTALVRREEAAAEIRSEQVDPVIGDMGDYELVKSLASKAEGVIHTAATGDERSEVADRTATEAIIAGMGTSGSPLVRTGGVWVHGSGDGITENTPRNAPGIVSWREDIDLSALEAPGIRSVLIEPGIVFGHGQGIPNIITRAEAVGDEEPAVPLVGDGSQHWTTVHVEDLARLYMLALQEAPHGSVYLGVSGDNPTVRQIGEAASHARGLGGRVRPEEARESVGRLGPLGEALLLDQTATGQAAKDLGWTPQRPGLLDEIATGSYTDS